MPSLPWNGPLPLVGMVHLLPLPGAPRWGGSMDEVGARALSDARALEAAGLDGVMVENYGDAPFLPGRVEPETVAALAVVAAELVRTVRLPVGVNVLRNDARSALGIAAAAGASFLRVNVHAGSAWSDQGTLEGRAWETLRARRALGSEAAVLADVHVKHATPVPGQTIEEAARDTWERGLADVLVVSGARTGHAPDAVRLRAVREALPRAPVWIGSGLDRTSLPHLLPWADGAIVGSALQRDGRAGNPVEERLAAGLVDAVRAFRQAGG